MTQICVSKLAIIGSDNGLSPGRRQTIIWINAGILLIGSLGTNFSEILMEIYKFLFKKMHLKMSSGKWRLSCLGLNVLIPGMVVLLNSRRHSGAVDHQLIRRQWTRARRHIMMTSTNGNIFRFTGYLCGAFTGHRWIPRTKSNDTELWCFLSSVPEYTAE